MVLTLRAAARVALAALLPLAAAAAADPPVQVASAAGANAPPPVLQHYTVREVDSANLWLEPPQLPDLTVYTDAAIEAKIPKNKPGHAEVRRMVDVPTLHEFVGGRGRLGEWAARQRTNPVAIFIEGGVMTPKDLAKEIGSDYFEQLSPGTYMARLPIIVQPGATMHIDAATKELRLSTERGAFLVNDGLMFITQSRVTGWRESANAPATFRAADEFRPFIVSWGGAEIYVTHSVFTSLGYDMSKSYGMSITQYSPGMDKKLQRKRPTGWILNSEFSDHFFGFYCYEADNVVLLNNVYKDNIVYGIDPHDRSKGLIIAHNTVSGSHKKHGIIISREVNDSWILWNRVEHNKLSGIVIDRSSVRNVVAYNDLIENGTDGITIYESPTNLLWNNRASSNNNHGIRVRNSVDIRLYGNTAVANRLAGIYGHIKDLRGTDRNLQMDPFEASVSMVIVGGQLIFNGSTPFAIDKPISLELYGVDLLAPTKKNGIQLAGVLGRHQQQILDILIRQRGAVVVEPSMGDGREVVPADASDPDAHAFPIGRGGDAAGED